MKGSMFQKDFWAYLSIFGLIIVIICLFPFLFTRIGFVDFRETGQIGDTIGGIMGPFVAIAAALLTFLAFWVQFKANVVQRTDIQTERFESNLFNYFQLLNIQLGDSEIPHVGNKKQSFHFMFYEFKAICYYLQRHSLSKEKELEKEIVFKCAYIIFINGVSLSDAKRLKEENNGVLFEAYGTKVNTINKYFLRLDKKNVDVQYLRDYNTAEIKLFDGHRLRLIPFYRSICIIVKYICEEMGVRDKDSVSQMANFKELDFYLNLLCSQMSEHQIALLKIIHKYSDSQEHVVFNENEGVKYFFEGHINKFLTCSTMDCEKWNFLDDKDNSN